MITDEDMLYTLCPQNHRNYLYETGGSSSIAIWINVNLLRTNWYQK